MTEITDNVLAVVAIIVLGILNAWALYLGYDGQITGMVAAIIGGIAGYEYAKTRVSE